MKNNRAFTLVELLVVIAIIAIMSVFVLGSFSRSTRDAGVAEATNSVVSFIRKARHNATAVLEHPERPGVYPSYGIHFSRNNPDTIILYADCKADDNESGRIELTDEFHFRQNNCAGAGKVDELILNNARITDIEFNNIDINEYSGSLRSFNVLYIRPEPTVWFSGTEQGMGQGQVINFDAGEARITVSNLAGTESKVIRVNSVGLIVVE